MIVLDEQLNEQPIHDSVLRWYKGAVANIKNLRPATVIKDEAVPTVLRRVSQPTFVTINYNDFWNKISASNNFCVVCIKLPKERKYEVPDILREVSIFLNIKPSAPAWVVSSQLPAAPLLTTAFELLPCQKFLAHE